MRKWCLALAVVGAVSVSASVPAQAQKWFDGLYVGLNAGLGWGDHDRETIFGFKNPYDSSGHLLGGHIGYSVQSPTSFLWGVEADAAWTNIKGDDNGVGGTTDESRFNWLASVRARLGFVSSFNNPNDLLVFGTVGWGFAEMTHTNFSGVPSKHTINVDGLTYGFGAQLALNNIWSVGVEWRRYDLGSYSVDAAGLNPFKVDNTLDTFSIRATMCLTAC